MVDEFLDGHNRRIEYLRVSVTDRCNLKCQYCMPPKGSDPSPPCDILKLREILDLINIFARLGVGKFRFTGGEPLTRKGFLSLVRQTKAIAGVEELALTTNGNLLEKMAPELLEAGVGVVNISLDSLNPERYRAITGMDMLERTLAGLRMAMSLGFKAVKVNVVVMRGVNDGEIEDFVRMAMENAVQVRFIEYMPATPSAWVREKFLPMEIVMEKARRVARLEPAQQGRWAGPARIFHLEGGAGQVGFISPVSRHHCASCNRVRLTADGRLLTCLFASGFLDLKGLLRSGASAVEIARAIVDNTRAKGAIGNMQAYARLEDRAMYRIGG